MDSKQTHRHTDWLTHRQTDEQKKEKSHTCEEGGAHLENLFCIYWWTWKTNNYSENCWSGPIKNKLILIFTMLHFFKKIKKKHL